MFPCYPALDKKEEKIVQMEITKVVNEQISFISYYLKIPFLIISLVFEASSIFSKGKRFQNLKKEEKIKLIQCWNKSSINFNRDFIKFFRTLTLFAFYDHPIIHEKLGFNLEKQKNNIKSKRYSN